MKNAIYLLVLCCVWYMASCSSAPVAGGGGTHTGNPEISAAAVIANDVFIKTFAEDSVWLPSHYLDKRGKQCLSPFSVSSVHKSRTTLARQIIVAQDELDSLRTAPAVYDTVVDTSYYYHPYTKIKQDTIFQVDTILLDGEVIIQVSRIPVTDTLFGIDTTAIIDTIINPRQDTIFVIARDSVSGDTLVDTLYLQAPQPIRIYPNPAISAVISSDSIAGGINFNFIALPNTEWAYYPPKLPVATRHLSISNSSLITFFNEAYTDLDGDSILETSYTPQLPLVGLSASYATTSSTHYVTAAYEPGPDYSLATIDDNRIVKLLHSEVSGTDTMVLATYEHTSYKPGCDVYLHKTLVHSNDAVRNVSIDYAFNNGANIYNESDDTLKQVIATAACADNDVATIQVSCIPSMTLAGNKVTTGNVTIVIKYNDGVIGLFTGTVQGNFGIVGEYSIHETKSVWVLRPDGTVEVGDVE